MRKWDGHEAGVLPLARTARYTAMIRNAMTVDVEDYLHVSAFEKHIHRDDWDSLPCRVGRSTERILDLFAEANEKSTFFMLGWVAERCPSVVRRIVAEGHELASHGYSHVRVTEQTPQVFREDVIRNKQLLEDMGGVGVQDTGHIYSSSIYPIRHDLYGMPEAPRFPFLPNGTGGLLEIPVTTVELLNQKWPCGGGGYFRLLPYALSRWAMRRVNHADAKPCVFYFHPWEIDPEQPRQHGIGIKTRFRHYVNLARTEGRLRRLLRDFHWDRMVRVFLGAGAERVACRA